MTASALFEYNTGRSISSSFTEKSLPGRSKDLYTLMEV
jgi:hypothetical protein